MFELCFLSWLFSCSVVDGKDRTDMLTFHGCEKDLAGALSSHVEVHFFHHLHPILLKISVKKNK